MFYVLNFTPKSAPRPIHWDESKTVYPPEYTRWKYGLARRLEQLNIPQKKYKTLTVLFFLTYPTKTPYEKRVDNLPHQVKPDVDNLLKAFMDAIEEAGIVYNDSRIAFINARKYYTTDKRGKILFRIR